MVAVVVVVISRCDTKLPIVKGMNEIYTEIFIRNHQIYTFCCCLDDVYLYLIFTQTILFKGIHFNSKSVQKVLSVVNITQSWHNQKNQLNRKVEMFGCYCAFFIIPVIR